MRITRDIVFLFLLTMALVGYSEAEWPWMPEHESHVTVETVYWEVE